MKKLLTLLSTGLLLSLFIGISPSHAISFSEYRNEIYFDFELTLDIDFSGNSTDLYVFRMTNVGDLSLELKRNFLSMPLALQAEQSCKITDSHNNKFPLIYDEKNLIFNFPPEPINFQAGETYHVLLSCEEPHNLQFANNGIYILKIEAVKYPFNNNYYDKSHLIMKLPDDFWHNTEFISSSPQPQKILNDNGRLLLEFSKEQITKNQKIVIPTVIIRKNLDWNLIINLIIAGLLTILTFQQTLNLIKKFFASIRNWFKLIRQKMLK